MVLSGCGVRHVVNRQGRRGVWFEVVSHSEDLDGLARVIGIVNWNLLALLGHINFLRRSLLRSFQFTVRNCLLFHMDTR